MKISINLFLLLATTSTMTTYLPLRLDQTSQTVAASSTATLPLLIILFLVTLIIGKLLILPPKIRFNPAQINQKTAFVFDLHGVVFRFNPLQAVHAALVTKHKLALLRAVLNPYLIWDVLKLLHTSAVVEEAIMAIGHKYPSLKELVPLALSMANQQVPIEPTIRLITQLRQSGFKIFVFSNIGERSAQILQEKYPEIFALFDGILVTSAQDNYLMKPSEQAFLKFLNKFNFAKEQIVFIDDKQTNIHVARKMGISAIQFINPHQCRQILQHLHAIT